MHKVRNVKTILVSLGLVLFQVLGFGQTISFNSGQDSEQNICTPKANNQEFSTVVKASNFTANCQGTTSTEIEATRASVEQIKVENKG